MTIENYAVIAIGVIALVCGLAVFKNRQKLFGVFTDAHRAFGGALGRQVAKRASSFWVGFVGAGIIAIGVVAILIGIFARE